MKIDNKYIHLQIMRKLIDIPDELVNPIKEIAKSQNKTLKKYIEMLILGDYYKIAVGNNNRNKTIDKTHTI